MSGSIWIANNIGWEYDDNYYYRSEYHDGRPAFAYTDQKIAEDFVKDLNIREIRSLGDRFFDYVRPDDVGYSDEEKALFYKEFGIDYSNQYPLTFSTPMEELSDEKLIKIAEFFNVIFYELVEVSLVA